jgi:hypothetical protein
MKTCTKCGITQDISCFCKHKSRKDGLNDRCRKCSNEIKKHYYQANRKKIKEYDHAIAKTERRKKFMSDKQRRMKKKYPQKYKARQSVYHALKSGKLTRQPCEVCGNPKVEAHHDDYSKPLDVRWLCHKHHREVHGQQAIEDDEPTTPTFTEKPL